MTSRLRTYSELKRLEGLEERFRYLVLRGDVANATFGAERYVNQLFYRSRQWRDVRNYVIARDQGCDLAVEDYEIHDRILVHHMNPMTVQNIEDGDPSILDPEFLISTTHRTHNAIHYGDFDLLPKPFVPRTPNDTKLW